MPYDAQGCWYPKLFPKQLEVFNTNKRAVLVCGPRLSGKTVAVLGKVVRHLWETPNARVAMFSRTMKNSQDGGPWMKLNRETIREWINAKIGLNYTTVNSEGVPGWKVGGQTRTPYLRIRNVHGGESECMLFSLDYDHDVEDKLKEMEFSMIYFSELDKFHSRKILSVALSSLRMQHLKFEQQQWIADCNPSEEGEQSWIYQTFYVDRVQTYEDYLEAKQEAGAGLDVLSREEFHTFQDNLQLIEILPEDNIWLDPRQLLEVKQQCAYDPGLYARYFKGKWVYGDGDASRHYRGFFNPTIHVVGNVEAKEESEWTTILPTENCFELVLGFDLGDTNHAAVILEKTIVNEQVTVNSQTIVRAVSNFALLDELVSLGQDISHDSFTESFMEMIEALENQFGKKYDLSRAWSDRSSIEKYDASADTYPYLLVSAASGGRVYLRSLGRAQGKGNVKMRVKLMKQLLSQKRIKISAHCTNAIQMLKDLKKGQKALNYIAAGDDNRHVHDALTYALMGECMEELEFGNINPTGKRTGIAVQVR